MALKIRKQLVTSRQFTSSGINPRTYITVHGTGNTNKGANAAAHANLQARGNSRRASWHWTVDDHEAVQSFPDTVRCWHAGDGTGPGNSSSIGVEICVNSDGDYLKALDNAAQLIAHLMQEHGVPLSKVVQHHRWSGKNCPQTIRAGKSGVTWEKFLDMVASKSGSAVTPAPSKPSTSKPSTGKAKTIAEMANEVIAGQHGSGHATRRKSLGVTQAVYEQVRAEVNRRLGVPSSTPTPSRPAPTPTPAPASKSVQKMAQEVIDGKHGNGHANRQKSLGVNAATYEQVRNEVNRLAGGGSPARPAGKTVAQMATEVIAGKHGNGHANRQRSLGVSNAVYQQVRAEVNRRTL